MEDELNSRKEEVMDFCSYIKIVTRKVLYPLLPHDCCSISKLRCAYIPLPLLQGPLSVLQTSSCVGMGVALGNGSSAMEQMIVEMAVMRARIKTAVSTASQVLNINGGTVCGSQFSVAEGCV